MKYSYKFSDTIHLLSHLEIFKNGGLSSEAVVASVESNPSIVGQLVSDLRNVGLIETRQGKASTKLTRKPSAITLFETYMAIDVGHELIRVDPQTNLKCPVGRSIQTSSDGSYEQIQSSAFNQMKAITLQDIIDDILEKEKMY